MHVPTRPPFSRTRFIAVAIIGHALRVRRWWRVLVAEAHDKYARRKPYPFDRTPPEKWKVMQLPVETFGGIRLANVHCENLSREVSSCAE